MSVRSEHPDPSERCLGLETPCPTGGESRCEACSRYAELAWPLRAEPPMTEPSMTELSTTGPLEPLEPAVTRPMPAALAARLRAMNDDFADADPLYVRALAGEPLADAPGSQMPGESENPGRRAAHDALAVTFADARRRRVLPPALADRLRAVPRRAAAARLPVYLADSRWATAASLILTALLALAAGDVSARFQAITDPAPLVSRLDATDERLETAQVEARSRLDRRLDRFAAWRQETAAAAERQWQDLNLAATLLMDDDAHTLDDLEIDEFLDDLLQQGENDD